MTVFTIKDENSATPQKMLMIVMKGPEYAGDIRAIHQIDKESFIIVYNIADVQGFCFNYQPVV